ncbi:uncharacterized protein LOC121880135 [Homarus americanus]|uniref:uncharacterized protein LOC121880135 n=1 Tax=Homarus americanus TaxID=6706 RepID=UPI001C45A215|nr:uncharacterized protein LOC121880135 [Homarus americanus]
MIMDAKTHNSNPPPGGGWVESSEEVSGVKKGGDDGASSKKSPPTRLVRPESLVPPDGGWGWVIIAANCIIMLVMGNIVVSFGVLYVHLVDNGYSNTEVSGIPALFVGFTFLLAPLSTGLSRFYSHRCLTMIGVIIVSLAVFLCSFYKSLIWLYICFGVLAGFGNGLVMPQCFLNSQKFFHHKKVTANGLSLLGVSVGFMIMPLLICFLVEHYAVQGTFMIWSGLLFHALIGAFLFQPIEWHMKPKRVAALESLTIEQNGGQSQRKSYSYTLGNKLVVAGKVDDQKDLNSHEDDSVVKHLTSDKEESDDSDQEDLCGSQDLTLCSDSMKKGLSDSLNLCNERPWKNPLTDTLQTNEYLERPRTVSIERSMEILPQIPEESEDEDCFETYDQQIGNERIEFLNRENDTRNRPVSFISSKSVESFIKATTSESIFYFNCDIIYQFTSALSVKNEKVKDRFQAERERSQEFNIKIPNVISSQTLKPHVICGIKLPRLSAMLNFGLLTHPVFLIIFFNTMVTGMVGVSFLNYLPSLSLEVGVGRNNRYLFIIYGSFEFAAKIFSSVMSDKVLLQQRYLIIIASLNSALANLSKLNLPSTDFCELKTPVVEALLANNA